MTNVINELKSLSVTFKTDEPMNKHTSFKTGGPAKVFVLPNNEDELMSVLSLCRKENIEPFILGNGSNLLVGDEGIVDKVVISIGSGFDYIKEIDETTLEVGAGTSLAVLCKFALSKSLSGLEFAFGIPGSVGGAAFMNAGAYGGEMKDVLSKCNHITYCGERGSFAKDELDLSYRHSAYSKGGYVITSVVVSLQKGEKEEIEGKMYDFLSRRKDKQPLEYPSAGSVFKRPEGYFAGALIEQCGLKGKRIGGAMVSEKHAGFIINYENATTSDVVALIEYCKKTVKENTSVDLETEIRFI